jgi:hypothetical protein
MRDNNRSKKALAIAGRYFNARAFFGHGTMNLESLAFLPAHHMMQRERNFVGMSRAPGNDALELYGIVSDGADLH